MNCIGPSNKSALEFNLSSEARMNEICHPLQQFGISMFTFVRTFYCGKRIYLSTDPKWVKHYLRHNFQDDLDHMEHYLPPPEIKYSFWVSFKRDDVFDSLHQYGVGHGFTIFEHHDLFVNQFDFSTHRDNYAITNFYVTNIHILEEFIKDFKIKAFDLMCSNDQSRLIFPSNNLQLETIPRPSFITQDNISDFMEKITSRETPNLKTTC